jgi:hypothetical protein
MVISLMLTRESALASFNPLRYAWCIASWIKGIGIMFHKILNSPDNRVDNELSINANFAALRYSADVVVFGAFADAHNAQVINAIYDEATDSLYVRIWTGADRLLRVDTLRKGKRIEVTQCDYDEQDIAVQHLMISLWGNATYSTTGAKAKR